MLRGLYTALVTPFRRGKIDSAAFGQLIQRQIRAGVDGIVPVGTTGESPTLSYDEHVEVIALAVKFAAGKIKVMAGTGGNSTAEAVYLTKEAARVGADSSLQVAPYYNRPTQEGLYRHFLEVCRATTLPIILYSIPSRCGVEIAVETGRRLAAISPRVVGIKEAGGNPDRVTQWRQTMGPRFAIFSGDDSQTLPFMALGADGLISVASNIIPRQMLQLTRHCAAGRFAEARKIYARYHRLLKDLFIETNPGPVKAAAAMLGQMVEEYRLPLVPLDPAHRQVLKATLAECGLLQS
jgi:4-hydroxy-tetrahydrodipicolinate synthase